MKTPRRFFLLTVSAMLFINHCKAEDDLSSYLEKFQTKINEQTSEDKTDQRHQGRTIALLKAISEAYQQKNLPLLEQSFANMSQLQLDNELQLEWMNLVTKVQEELSILQSKDFQTKLSITEQLVKDVQSGCLSAQKSSDLNPLRTRCTEIQPKNSRYVSNENNALRERITYLLQGATTTLNAWGRYLDLREKGHIESANQTLKSLLSNNSNYPVLTREEIEKFLQETKKLGALSTTEGPMSELATREYIYQGVTKPEHIITALERLDKIKNTPYNSRITSEYDTLSQLQSAWDMMSKGNADAALQMLDSGRLRSSSFQSSVELTRLVNQITTAAVNKQMSALAGIDAISDESADVVAKRAYQKLFSAQDFSNLEAAMRLYDRYFKAEGGVQWPSMPQYIGYYISAQRFEAAGDMVLAVNNYRQVVSSTASEFIPVELAVKALERINKSHPEVLANPDAAIIAELRTIQNRLNSLANRPQNPIFPIPSRLGP